MNYRVTRYQLAKALSSTSGQSFTSEALQLGPSFSHLNLVIRETGGHTTAVFSSCAPVVQLPGCGPSATRTLAQGFNPGAGLWCDFQTIGADPTLGIGMTIAASGPLPNVGATLYYTHPGKQSCIAQQIKIVLVRAAVAVTATYDIDAYVYTDATGDDGLIDCSTGGAFA